MFFFVGLPVPLGMWKVKYIAPGRFIARKMMKTAFPDAARQHLPKGVRRMNPLLWVFAGMLLLAFTFPLVSGLFFK